jgi:hypothetical protein
MQVNQCHNLPSNSGIIAVIVPARRFPPPWNEIHVSALRACRTVRPYPLPVRQPRLPPKKAGRGGRRQSRWSLTTNGFAYLNHRRSPTAFRRRGPFEEQPARARRIGGTERIPHYL